MRDEDQSIQVIDGIHDDQETVIQAKYGSLLNGMVSQFLNEQQPVSSRH